MRRFERPVYSLIVKIVRDSANAEELTQDTFLKAFRALDTFDTQRKFSSWLFKIAHNAAIDRLRKRELPTVALEDPQREGPDLLDSLATTGLDEADVSLRRKELASQLEEALSGLRPEYRAVLELRFAEDLAYEEIAEIVELPLGTVKTHLHRARRALHKALRAQGWGPEA